MGGEHGKLVLLRDWGGNFVWAAPNFHAICVRGHWGWAGRLCRGGHGGANHCPLPFIPPLFREVGPGLDWVGDFLFPVDRDLRWRGNRFFLPAVSKRGTAVSRADDFG